MQPNTLNHDTYNADGIHVEHFSAPDASADGANRPPVICVHGGCHGAWCWDVHAPEFAAGGYDVHALDWRGRGGSATVSTERFVESSIADVVDDIRKVASRFDVPPIVVGHSMGGLASQLYAARYDVAALVLLTPVVPSNVHPEPIELPIADFAAPWGPPPAEVARQLFFQGLSDDEARRYQALLVPESPKRVYEATRWTLEVDAARVPANRTLLVSGELDVLTPPQTGRALAEFYGCEYWLEPGFGHNVLLGAAAQGLARRVRAWVDAKRLIAQS